MYRLSAEVVNPYWMYCLSADLRLELFESKDFNCNAAVIVRDATELFRRMARAANVLYVQPYEGKAIWQPVSYNNLGGLHYGRSGVAISPFFTKPVGYSHHKEIRFVVYPCYEARNHTYIHLGSLEDICEVVSKDELERSEVDEVVWNERAFGDAAQEALLNNGPTLLAKMRGRKIRDLVKGEDGSVRVTNEKTYGNTAPRVLLDYLTEAPDGPRLSLDEIDLESVYKAEQISKKIVEVPKND